MNGRPVWLASLSRRSDAGRPIPTGQWGRTWYKRAARLLHQHALNGVGDPGMERWFRMNVTFCIHRALSDAEIAGLSCDWKSAPAFDLAGAPVEIIREIGCKTSPSAMPCLDPEHVPIPGLTEVEPECWIPGPCGKCPPCLARKEIEDAVGPAR